MTSPKQSKARDSINFPCVADIMYYLCFAFVSDTRVFQRMGLRHMAEKIPEGQQDDANMAGIEDDAMADDIDAQAQFYE
jgi:hypothetical protein